MPLLEEQPVISDKYLKDFVRMHEYRLKSRISEARADRLKRRLKHSHYPLIRS
ncbi:MAG TPA: hypothetical protein VGF75_01495 [Candidatus Saccharimonadales bacterium]